MELSGEEGRGKLRKATGRGKHSVIRGLPNGVTRAVEGRSCVGEHIAHASHTRGTEPSQYPEEKKPKRDSQSSGERNGRSPNRMGVKAVWRCLCGVVGFIRAVHTSRRGVTNALYSGMPLGRATREGDSPVCDMRRTPWDGLLSRAGHEKSCLNPGGPPSKATYETATDSAEVP